jgi:toxin ParE1/3/4
VRVIRATEYVAALQAVHDYIAADNPIAALETWLHIDDQVEALADPRFPRRKGRVAETFELVAHPNYIVLLYQTPDTVTAFDLVHAAMQYPKADKPRANN